MHVTPHQESMSLWDKAGYKGLLERTGFFFLQSQKEAVYGKAEES